MVQNSSSTLAGTSPVHRCMYVIGNPEKHDLVHCLLDPLRLPYAASPRVHVTDLEERGYSGYTGNRLAYIALAAHYGKQR